MEPEYLLPCSNDSTSGPYPEPDESTEYISILFLDIHLNIIYLRITNFPNYLPSGYNSVLFFFSTRATCSNHFIFLDPITLILGHG
jgi:hypothetical protein